MAKNPFIFKNTSYYTSLNVILNIADKPLTVCSAFWVNNHREDDAYEFRPARNF